MTNPQEKNPQIVFVPEDVAGKLSELEPGSDTAEQARRSLIAPNLGTLASDKVFGVYKRGEGFGYVSLGAGNLGDTLRPETAKEQGLPDPAEVHAKLVAQSGEDSRQDSSEQPTWWQQHNKVDLREKGPFSKAEKEIMNGIRWALEREKPGDGAKSYVFEDLNKQFGNKQVSERLYAMALGFMKVARAGRVMAMSPNVIAVDKAIGASTALEEDQKARLNMISSFIGSDRRDNKSESEISHWLFEESDIPQMLADPSTSETYRASLIGALAAVGNKATIKGQATLDEYLKTGRYKNITVINAQ